MSRDESVVKVGNFYQNWRKNGNPETSNLNRRLPVIVAMRKENFSTLARFLGKLEFQL
jgi:hypothetical protein